jgi:large subunit ribosomal protein L25
MEEKILELVELNAKVREKSGKGAAKQLRRNKSIPAIVYGRKIDPILLALDTAEFAKIVREQGMSGLFLDLKIDNAEQTKKKVMLKETQMDVFGKHYLHVDLQEIDMDQEITVSIPVQAVGTSQGVKEGGLLQIIRRELNVICKPTDRPEAVTIDISGMEVGDSIHVSEIDLGENIKIPYEMDFTVLTVIPPTAEAEPEGEDEDEPEEAAAEAAEEPVEA